MTDQELRAMIRDSISRQTVAPAAPRAAEFSVHPSHLRLALKSGGDEDGMCIIEPAVRCTHCGFCQSLGH